MKHKKIIVVLVLFILNIVFIGKVYGVSGPSVITWSTGSASSSTSISGTGGFIETAVGFRISVYSDTFALKGSIVITDGTPATHFSKPNDSALNSKKYNGFANSPTVADTRLNSWIPKYNFGPGGLQAKLEDKNYEILTALLNILIEENKEKNISLNATDYIIVEPMIKITTQSLSSTIKCEQKRSCTFNTAEVPQYARTCPANYLKGGFTVPGSYIEYSESFDYFGKQTGKFTIEFDEYKGCTRSAEYTDYESYFLTLYEFYASNAVNSNYACIGENEHSGTDVFGICYDDYAIIPIAKSIYFYRDLKNGNAVLLKKASDYSSFIECVRNKKGGCAIGAWQFNKISPKGTIKIEKRVEGTNALITSKPATFRLYEKGDCTGSYKDAQTKSGVVTFDNLNPNLKYSIKELKAPEGYEEPSSNNCIKNITVVGGQTTLKTVYNEPTCATRLQNLGAKPTKAQLVDLWKGYKTKTNLLNFNNPSCTVATCTDGSGGCLTGSYDDATFNENNWSCKTDLVDVNGKTGFCKTTFNLSKTIPDNLSPVKSGQLYFNLDDFNLAHGKIMQGSFAKQCYFLDNPGVNSFNSRKISDYLNDVQLGSIELSIKEDSDVTLTTTNGTSYSYSKDIEYTIPEVWVSNGSGKICTDITHATCKSLGYGILSKLTQVGKEKFRFSLMFNSKRYMGLCQYEANPELVTGCPSSDPSCQSSKLNLEFRIIDVNNPFPGRKNATRRPGSNWRLIGDINNDGNENEIDIDSYQDCISKMGLKCDFDRDGTIGRSDYDIFIKYVTNMYRYYLLNRPNSYGIVPQTGESKVAKYVIELTPSDIKKIRNDNKNKKYDDYNMTCNSNGTNCISTYLSDLYSEGLLLINDSAKRVNGNWLQIKPE